MGISFKQCTVQIVPYIMRIIFITKSPVMANDHRTGKKYKKNLSSFKYYVFKIEYNIHRFGVATARKKSECTHWISNIYGCFGVLNHFNFNWFNNLGIDSIDIFHEKTLFGNPQPLGITCAK